MEYIPYMLRPHRCPVFLPSFCYAVFSDEVDLDRALSSSLKLQVPIAEELLSRGLLMMLLFSLGFGFVVLLQR